MTTSSEQLRRSRYAQRVRGDNGRLISTICPEATHGKSTGYMTYGCHCDACNAWYDAYRAVQVQRKIHNRFVLTMGLQPHINRCPQAPETPPIGSLPTEDEIEHVELVTLPEGPEFFEDDEPVEKIQTAFDSGAQQVTRAPIEIKGPDTPKAPPVIPSVRERITSVATLEKISKAYFTPQWVAPATGHDTPDLRERRVFEDMEIIVGDTDNLNGPVLWFKERDLADVEPVVAQPQKALPKAKGGRGGSTKPTTFKDLMAKLKSAGCEITTTGGGHVKVTRDGQSLIMPSTASDYRALANTLANARKAGLL